MAHPYVGSNRGSFAKTAEYPEADLLLLDGIYGSPEFKGTYPQSHGPTLSTIAKQTPQVPNECQEIPVNTELDLSHFVDRLREQSAGFSPTPLRTRERKGFPSVMKYPFETPDATYPSPCCSNPILEQINAPQSISSIGKAVTTYLPAQYMKGIVETQAQDLPQSDAPERSPSRASALRGRGYSRGRARGSSSGRGRGRGQGLGPEPGRVRGQGSVRTGRVGRPPGRPRGRPRAGRGLSDINRATATATTQTDEVTDNSTTFGFPPHPYGPTSHPNFVFL